MRGGTENMKRSRGCINGIPAALPKVKDAEPLLILCRERRWIQRSIKSHGEQEKHMFGERTAYDSKRGYG